MIKWTFPLKWLLFCVCYFSLAFLCLETRDNGSLSSAIWLPAGLTLGVLCSAPISRWPLWLVSTGILHILVSILHQRPMNISLVFALNDLIILCLSAHIWKIILKDSGVTSRLNLTAIFIAIVLIASMFGGISTFYSLRILGYPTLFSHFIIWSISNATGCLAFAPFFAIKSLSSSFSPDSNPKSSLLLLIVIPALTLVLFSPRMEDLQNATLVEPMIYFLFGFTLLSSLFISTSKLSLLFISLAFIISLTKIYNQGIFAADDYTGNSGITASQLYLLAIFIFSTLIRAGTNDIHLSRAQSDQLMLLSHCVSSHQRRYSFRVNITQQKWVWTELIDSINNFPINNLTTPSQMLGRMHPEDRDILLPWFNGINKTGATPFSRSVRLILDGTAFSQAYIAMLSDQHSNANKMLNGILIAPEHIPSSPTGHII
ncbi:MASE1 domain-containing protein [Serratia sp. M24T3]|uniref:MASE1 domain-containing protein n=1 Tax=Serratia sp. M24T3 TaxID=932213 RepID=UPI00025B9C09|nr:MASE1 domain-containing protein [Serratia sp. M24T3]EIC83836.1 hypothetical protein SPM24T3_14801 [Serratia sp. M24T3]